MIGYFIQPEYCKYVNPSGTNKIPTFTCNFKSTIKDAENHMKHVMEIIFELFPILKSSLLRVRCEGGLPVVQFKKEQLEYVIPKSFPKQVYDKQYYDAHIHVLDENWEKIRKEASRWKMPIIYNDLKEKKVPFITVRWYNTTIHEALNNLEQIYIDLCKTLTLKSCCEFEVTLNDPYCDITDKGWIPTPENDFDISGEEFKIF